jgi:hypothetical protein
VGHLLSPLHAQRWLRSLKRKKSPPWPQGQGIRCCFGEARDWAAFLASLADSGQQRLRCPASSAAKRWKIKGYSDDAGKPELRGTARWSWQDSKQQSSDYWKHLCVGSRVLASNACVTQEPELRRTAWQLAGLEMQPSDYGTSLHRLTSPSSWCWRDDATDASNGRAAPTLAAIGR